MQDKNLLERTHNNLSYVKASLNYFSSYLLIQCSIPTTIMHVKIKSIIKLF